MRVRIREQFRDIRTNTVVVRALWNYVESITGPGGLKVLEVGSPMRAITSTGGKRKRKNSEDDGDYHPSPIQSLGSKTKTRSQGRK